MFNGNIYTCAGKITDSGGSAGPYGKNEKFTTTICSDNPKYSLLQLAFETSDLKPGDELCIYDGINTNFPLITCTSQTGNFPFVVQTTKDNPAGCLTLVFTSDNFLQGSGFIADISCKPVCQEVLASISSAYNPNGGTADIDICAGEVIQLSAAASFPENNLNYNQKISSCKFEWYLDNKIASTASTYNVPIFTEGGHSINLLVTDTLGCKSQNLALQKVRVAPKPSFIENNIEKLLCVDEQIDISTAIKLDPSKNLSLKENYGFFPQQDFVIDSVALPDGTGNAFSSVLFIGKFNPNEIIDDPDDLNQVCITVEHSFLSDIEITLTCPNGQKIILQEQGKKTGVVHLGEPVEDDELLPDPIPGLGYLYCWQMGAPNGTWNDYVLKNSPKTLPAGVYAPYQSFENLYGCPIDGLWTINVKDLWKNDNGYLFYWSMEFNPDLYPPADSFTNVITSAKWLPNETLISQAGNSMSAAGTAPGEVTHVWEVSDDHGCAFHHPVKLQIRPELDPSCDFCMLELNDVPDQDVCAGEPVSLSADIQPGGLLTKSNFVAMSSAENLGVTNLDIRIPVSLYNFPATANISDLINSVCLTASADDLSNTDLSLITPDDKEIRLYNKNEINSGNIVSTCFTPQSNVPLSSGSGNYTGSFRPASDFIQLQNCKVKGDWRIRVRKPAEDKFTLTEANLDFNIINKLHYSWQSSSLIDCDTCQSVIVKAGKNDKVQLYVYDDYSCSDTKNINLNVLPVFAAPVLTFTVKPGGTIEFSWTAVPGASSYQISINGQPWTLPNGTLSHTMTNLPPGTVINFSVKASSGAKDCPNDISTISASINDCGLVTLVETTAESCIGTNDGQIKLNVSNATGSLSYSLNGGTPVSNGTFSNLPSGNYNIIITDANGCKDTIQAEIKTAPPISINNTIKDVSCFGLSDGSISVEAYGGTGSLTYSWTGYAGTDNNAISLPAGSYTLTIFDSKNCSVTETFVVNQPEKLVSTPVIEKPGCYGATDGIIDLQPQGGTKPYQFTWFDGQGQVVKTGLGAGSYKVTITDVNGCSLIKNILVTQPTQMKDTLKVVHPSCFGDTDGSIEINVGGGTVPYTYSWDGYPGNSTSKLTNLPAGSYAITVSDANGCKVKKSLTLVDPPVVEAKADVEDESCSGLNNGMAEILMVSGKGPFIFTWPAGVNAVGSKAMNLTPGSYTVKAENAKGCSTVIDFVVNAAPPFDAYVDVPVIDCKSTNGTATVVITDGAGPFTYLWNDPLNQTGSQATSLSVGNYKVSVTDAQGCVHVLDAVLTSNDPIIADKLDIKSASCSYSADGSIDVAFKGGSLPYTISWDNGLPANVYNPQNLAPGKYQYTVTDNIGCTLSGEAVITAPEVLSLTGKAIDAACKYAATGELEIQVSGGTQPYQAVWSNAASGTTIGNLSAGNYTVTITDANSCIHTQQFSISEPAAEFIIEASQKLVSCHKQNKNSAEVKMISGSGTMLSHLWNTAATAQTINNLANGVYTVTATDSYGCKQTASVNVQDWQPVDFETVTVQPTCAQSADAKITVTNMSGGAGVGIPGNYLVSWNNQPAGTTFTQNNLTGGQTVSIVVTDQQGCSASKDVLVPVTAEIDFVLDTKQPSCYQAADGSLEIMNVTGGSAPFSYKWNTGANTQIINSLKAGTYACTITDGKSCTRNVSSKITDPPAIKLTENLVTSPVCENDTNGSISLSASGGKAPYVFKWQDGSSNDNLSGLAAGTYSVTVSDNAGCSVQKSIQIKAQNNIEAFAEILTAACFDESTGSVAISVKEGKSPLQFSLGGAAFTPDNYFDKLASGNYSATVKDKDGCLEIISFAIKSGADFQIGNIQDVSVEYGETLKLTPDLNLTGPVTLKWNTINVAGTECDSCRTLIIQPKQDGYVWLNVQDENGCAKQVKFFVDVVKDYHVFVPTAFSPNNDGVNDFLSVFARDGISVVDFAVFDQWGEMVYSVKSPVMNEESKGWDGSLRGQPMNSGVYIWMLKAKYPDGSTETLSGETTLLR